MLASWLVLLLSSWAALVRWPYFCFLHAFLFFPTSFGRCHLHDLMTYYWAWYGAVNMLDGVGVSADVTE